MNRRGDDEAMTVRLAGAIVHGAPIDTSAAGVLVAVPRGKVDTGDEVYRVARSGPQCFGIERGDLLVVEPRPNGNAATAELVLVTLHGRVFIGRWWSKCARRALLDEALHPISEDADIRVLGAVTVIVRTDA